MEILKWMMHISAQLSCSLEKCNFKCQHGIMTYLPKWLKLKRWRISSVDKDVEQLKLSCTSSGSLKQSRHFRSFLVRSTKAEWTHILCHSNSTRRRMPAECTICPPEDMHKSAYGWTGPWRGRGHSRLSLTANIEDINKEEAE